MLKKMNFAPHLIPLILEGKKYLTYRLDPRYKDFQLNEIVELCDKSTGKLISLAKIVEKYEIEYEKISHNAVGHEIYESKDDMTAEFEKYYNLKPTPETKTLVLKYELVKQNNKKANITIEDFIKIDMRVGLVKEAVPVPDSKKLIKLIVDLGADYGEVTILTGMLTYFPDPSVLVNKKYLILANLAPRKMAGIESQGMFLAADGGTKPTLIEMPSDTQIGAVVR